MNKDRDIRSRLWAIRPWHIAAILVCVLLITSGALRVTRRMELHARIEAVRAGGYPVTLAELNAWYRTPAAGENAADFVVPALERLRWPQGQEKEQLPGLEARSLLARTQPLDDRTRSAISKLLDKNAAALSLLEQGSLVTHCRYPVDFTRDRDMRLPDTSEFHLIVSLFCLKAILDAEQAEAGAAADATICAYRLADSLAGDPALVPQMVRGICQQRATTTLERVLSRVSLDAGHLEQLEQALTAACDPNTLERAFVGERCVMLDNFHKPIDFAAVRRSEELSLVRFQMARASGGLDSAKTRYLDLIDRYIEVTRLPIHERVRAAARIKRETDRMRDNRVFLSRIMPVFDGVITSDVASIAHLLTARTALAVERYRLATGQLPGQLADLVPIYMKQVPQDPFDGQSLRYSRLGKGYVVYSIGRDLSDNGGQERAPGSGGQPEPDYDITFIVER